MGGIADYAHEQANALVDLGVAVDMLTTAQRPARDDCRYQIRSVLDGGSGRNASRLARKLSWAKRQINNFRTLSREIRNNHFQTVLLESYAEYLAPLWAGQFRALARAHVKFGAVIHDPVRDYVVGPRWWHRRSIAEAYSFLSEAFVHEKIQLDTVRPMPTLRTTVIPHGPFRFPEPTESRGQARKKLALPDDAVVVLSFGYIRDGKNLDLAIRALADLPSTYLVVAGKEQSSTQKPIGYYQELARGIGIQERCRWLHGHVPQNEIGNLFAASDLVLLTYSRDFRSASGVLNTAVQYRRPCVASSGGGNLQSVVERYQLGWFVTPDDLNALKAGITEARQGKVNPRWNDYESEHSWPCNAKLVKEKMFNE